MKSGLPLFVVASILFSFSSFILLPASSETPTFENLLENRVQLDQTVWAKERTAQDYERSITRLWDDLLVAEDPYSVFLAQEFESFEFPTEVELAKDRDNAVRENVFGGKTRTLDLAAFREKVSQFKADGFAVEMTEWHHAKFFPKADGGPRSVVSATLYVHNPKLKKRYIIKTHLVVNWTGEQDEQGFPAAQSVALDSLKVSEREDSPAFTWQGAVKPETAEGKRVNIEAVIAYDLDRDSLTDVVLSRSNLVLWNKGNDRFDRKKLLANSKFPVFGKTIADFTGDGIPDYLAVSHSGETFLYLGQAEGQVFADVGKKCWDGVLKNPQISPFTAGDIDGDGDLDLWLDQYKDPYTGGQMPTPFYDANDGYPGYLLANDGDGNFTDVTAGSGLEKKRDRRTYSASFLDFDDDGDLDLLNVSDYSGVDVFYNDGKGQFTDVTDEVVDERHNFGMSHAFGDFNSDGRLDVFVTGMGSTTARRLEHMGLGPKDGDKSDVTNMRMKMGYGNRMYLWKDGKLVEPDYQDTVARTGWSWGSTAFDADNDGDVDLYVCNGHSSGKSTQDYCTRFWCHDVYEKNSVENPALNQLFGKELSTLATYKTSWNGYEKNGFLVNQDEKEFVNSSYLLGTAFEYDARGVISEDLDNDGRMDLLVVEMRQRENDKKHEGQGLHVLKNTMNLSGRNWVGVYLEEEGKGVSPVGAKVTIHAGGKSKVQHITTGQFSGSQHSNKVHFGLGSTARVDAIEVRWPDGKITGLSNPEVGRYHRVLYDESGAATP